MIPYTPEQLLEIGKQEMAWCQKEMLRASQELGFGDDWKKAMDHVKNLHAPPGEQVQLVRKLAEEALVFLKERGLVTIPPLAEEIWRIEMMSPDAQKVNPYFLGGEVIRVSFPTDAMSHERKMMSMRGNNIHFSRATVQHELIPGHHLQMFMMSRYRPYRRPYGTPFWIEGIQDPRYSVFQATLVRVLDGCRIVRSQWRVTSVRVLAVCRVSGSFPARPWDDTNCECQLSKWPGTTGVPGPERLSGGTEEMNRRKAGGERRA